MTDDAGPGVDRAPRADECPRDGSLREQLRMPSPGLVGNLLWFAAGIAVGAIVTLTLFPGSPAPFLWAADRLAPRGVEPGELAFVLNVALFVPVGLVLGLASRPRLLWLAPAASVMIELTQWLVPQRQPNVWDVVANTGGALLGYVVGALVLRLLQRARDGGTAGAGG
ncbi:VanZ family protein [Egicoccus halophilus]|uniref:VanZ-like domain-containing protein n=1 Tax=Egicoccus halophilus TaxID=1670830 RepID=A0A8J3A744_9ACTN|nr:VanZ family protein [Egicoccus halophilus]GGI05306.1 hypothetical protein GCM10011354_13440 [Egicoccus halophilus]